MKEFYRRIKNNYPCISIGDHIQILIALLSFVGIILLYLQSNSNHEANVLSIGSQLYEHLFDIAADEMDDPESNFNTIWAHVPLDTTAEQYAEKLLGLVTDDPTARKSKTAEELYNNMWNSDVFADHDRRERTRALRKLFTFMQSNFYQIHIALDYRDMGILKEGEWITWKGPIREMHAHPMLLVVIWNGYQNRYFSRSFAMFLQEELCSEPISSEFDAKDFERQKKFVLSFYPEMCRNKHWPDLLPDY